MTRKFAPIDVRCLPRPAARAAGAIVLFLVLAGPFPGQQVQAGPLDTSSIVSRCITLGPRGATGCGGANAAEPVAALRRPQRTAPAALAEPAPDPLPVALRKGQPGPAGGRPAMRGATPVVLLPRATPDLSTLHRAQAVVRRGLRGTVEGLATLEDAVSRLRPDPWRSGYDAAGWRPTAARLAGLSPFGGPDARVPIASPLPGAAPGQVLRLRWQAGFDGAHVPDFAMPGLFVSRLLMVRYHHGPLFRVASGLGAVLLPMPVAETARAGVAPRLFPQAIAAARSDFAAEPAPSTPSPVPLPPAAPLLLAPLSALFLLGRRSGSPPSRAATARKKAPPNMG